MAPGGVFFVKVPRPTTVIGPDLLPAAEGVAMTEFCQNPCCENEGSKEVPVSVNGPGDQRRTLCAACEEAYSWGVQHGRFTAENEPLWIAVVTDRGIVAYARSFRSQIEAENAIIDYLTEHHGCHVGRCLQAVYEWVGEQAYLAAEIVEQDALVER